MKPRILKKGSLSEFTLGLVKQALAPTESILCQEYNRQLQKRYSNFKAQLEKDGMDARISFDYPHGSGCSRQQYSMQVERHRYCNKHSIAAPRTSYGMSAPDPRIIDEFLSRTKITVEAAKHAKEALESYCHKLTQKIEAQCTEVGCVVQSIKYSGNLNPWGSWSFVYVETNKGTQQWETKMIVNFSCLGKAFNQWPTRLAK